MMNLKIGTVIIALFMFAGAAGLAAGQDTKKNTHKKTRTVTGCLQKGEDANEYDFTAKNGGTWEVKSDSVKLDEHVEHTVAHRLNCEAGRRSARAKVWLRRFGRWGREFRRKPSLRCPSSSVFDRVAARE
jgi:hypothetical protein